MGTIAETFEKYPGIGALLPAMGYGAEQMQDLEATISAVPTATWSSSPRRSTCAASSRSTSPRVRVGYELQEIGKPDLADVLARF